MISAPAERAIAPDAQDETTAAKPASARERWSADYRGCRGLSSDMTQAMTSLAWELLAGGVARPTIIERIAAAWLEDAREMSYTLTALDAEQYAREAVERAERERAHDEGHAAGAAARDEQQAKASKRAGIDDAPPLDLWGSHLAGRPTLDLSTVPAVLGELASDVATRHGCDPALIALPALGVCAGAADDHHQVQPRQHDLEWRVSARLWVTPIADVGAGKSPALAVVYRPLRAIDQRWATEDEGPMQRYALAMRTHAKAIDRWLGQGSPGEPPDEPARRHARRRVVEDFTTEALAGVLAENPGGVLIAVDELAGLIGGMDAYRPSRAARDQPLYLQLFEGGPRLVERVGRGSVRVPNWGASLVGAIQPERLRKLAGHIVDDGLLARMVLCVAHDATDATDRPADRGALDRYAQTIERLVALAPPRAPYTLNPTAHLRRDYVARIARAVMVLPTTSPALRAHLAKWEGIFARLVLTWHLTDAASRGEVPAVAIGEQTADAVARLMVEYLLPHVAHVYGEILGQDHLTHARWIAGHILARQLDRITARDIGQARHGLRDDRRSLEEAMQTLTVAGWVLPLDLQAGRSPTRWRVCAAVHTIFARRAAAEQQRREQMRERIKSAAELLGAIGHEP